MILIIEILSHDNLLFAKAHSSNKITRYRFHLHSQNGSALLDIGANRSLVNT